MLPIVQDEAPRTFVQHDGSIWLRTGFCQRCPPNETCCRGDPTGGTRSHCALFAVDEIGRGVCTDREDPYYLNGCNEFPSKPEHLIANPTCTYRFEKVS